MGILIALFDPIDIFLKEFQNVMGDRLLRKESSFDNEVLQHPLLKFMYLTSLLDTCSRNSQETFWRRVLPSLRSDAQRRL